MEIKEESNFIYITIVVIDISERIERNGGPVKRGIHWIIETVSFCILKIIKIKERKNWIY